MSWTRIARGSAGAALTAVAVSELVTWRLSRRPRPVPPAGRVAVVVLGHPNGRRGRPTRVQRWRTGIGVRTLATVDDGWLIFCGGATRGSAEPEAAVMARHAVRLGVPSHRIQLETGSASTWDNVRLALPLVREGGAELVAIASDPCHAEKARRYLEVQWPGPGGRAVRADSYRFLERPWVKVLTVAYYVVLHARGGFGLGPSAGPPPAAGIGETAGDGPSTEVGRGRRA